jgi:hypothetical protein
VVVVVGRVTVVVKAPVLLPSWNDIMPEVEPVTDHDKDVDELAPIVIVADIWSPLHDAIEQSNE